MGKGSSGTERLNVQTPRKVPRKAGVSQPHLTSWVQIKFVQPRLASLSPSRTHMGPGASNSSGHPARAAFGPHSQEPQRASRVGSLQATSRHPQCSLSAGSRKPGWEDPCEPRCRTDPLDIRRAGCGAPGLGQEPTTSAGQALVPQGGALKLDPPAGETAGLQEVEL